MKLKFDLTPNTEIPSIDKYEDEIKIKNALKYFLESLTDTNDSKHKINYQSDDFLSELSTHFNKWLYDSKLNSGNSNQHIRDSYGVTSNNIEIKKVIEEKELVSLLITDCKSDALLFKILQNIYKNNKYKYFSKDILQNIPSILQDRYKEGSAETDGAKQLIDFIKKIGKDYGLELDIDISSPTVKIYWKVTSPKQTNPELLDKIKEQEERTEKLGLSGGWFSRLFGKSAEYKLMLEVFDWKKEVTPDDFQRLLATYSIKDLKWLEKIYSILFSKGNKARTENKEASFKYDFLEMLNKHISGLVDNKKPKITKPLQRRNVDYYGYKNNPHKYTEIKYNVPLSKTPWENQPWKLTEPLSDRKPDDGKLVTEEQSKTSGQSKGEQVDTIDGDGIVGPYFGNISHKPSNTDTQQDPTPDGDVHQSSVTGKEVLLLGNFSIPTNTGTLNESVLKPDTHSPVTSDVVVSNTQSPQDTTQNIQSVQDTTQKGKGKSNQKSKGKDNSNWGQLLEEENKWEGKNRKKGKPGSQKRIESQQEQWDDTLENSQLTSDGQPQPQTEGLNTGEITTIEQAREKGFHFWPFKNGDFKYKDGQGWEHLIRDGEELTKGIKAKYIWSFDNGDFLYQNSDGDTFLIRKGVDLISASNLAIHYEPFPRLGKKREWNRYIVPESINSYLDGSWSFKDKEGRKHLVVNGVDTLLYKKSNTKLDTKPADTQSKLTGTTSSTSLPDQTNILSSGPVNISSQPNTSSTQDEASSTSSIRQSGEASTVETQSKSSNTTPATPETTTPHSAIGTQSESVETTSNPSTSQSSENEESEKQKSKWYEKAWNKSQELVNSAKEKASNLGIKSIKILKGVGGVIGKGLNQMSSAIDKGISVGNFDLKKWTIEKKESLVKIAREQQERIKSSGLGEWAKSSVLGEKEEIMIYKRDIQNNIMTDEKGNRITETVQKRRRITKMPTHEIKLDEKTIKNRVGLVRSWEKQKIIFNDVGLKGNVKSIAGGILDTYNKSDYKYLLSGASMIATFCGFPSKLVSAPILASAKARDGYKKAFNSKMAELSKDNILGNVEKPTDNSSPDEVLKYKEWKDKVDNRINEAKKYARNAAIIKGGIFGGLTLGAGLLGEYWRGEGAGKYTDPSTANGEIYDEVILNDKTADTPSSSSAEAKTESTAKDIPSENKTDGSVTEKTASASNPATQADGVGRSLNPDDTIVTKEEAMMGSTLENKTDGSVTEKTVSASNPATPASGVASSPSTPSSAPNTSGIGAGNTASVDNSYTPNGNQAIDITDHNNYNNYKIQKGDNLENIFEKYMNNKYDDKGKDNPERLKEIYNMFANSEFKKALEEQGIKYIRDKNGGTFPNLIQTGKTLNLVEIFNKAKELKLITE